MAKIGDKIRIVSDNENYTPYFGKELTVSNVAHNTSEHPGYDTTMVGQALIDCEDFPFSLYEYEFEII